MPMLYIINDTRISEHLSDSIDVNSTTDIYLLNVLSVSLEENFPDIYEKINQEITWEQVINKARNKLIKEGKNADMSSIYKEIIKSSQRSRQSVNKALGVD